MLRSILIRQTFVWVDLTLALLVAGTAGLVIYSLLRPATVQVKDPLASMGLEPALPSPVARVEGRDAYAALVESGLFGEAGRFDPDAAPPPPPPPPPQDPVVEETQLNLRLIGTTDTADERFATAIIQEGEQSGSAGVYAVGEKILDNVFLKEVQHRKVIIENSTSGAPRLETLSMDEDKVAQAPASDPAPQPAGPEPPAGGVQRITLNRDELMQDIYANYAEIATKVRPELARDESGNVIGVTANNISAVPLARKLGLGDGDILQTVNKESIDSEQKIYEMIQKYQNASSIRIGVMSGGKPKVITYRLN
jgi:general secretion pathway protein C